jgi:hypothetical protein
MVGGSGKNLERNCHNSIENDLNFTADRTSNTDVVFVNLLEGHNNPWMNGRVMIKSLQLDQAQKRHGMPHIGVNDTSVGREDYTTHGLYVIAQGKKRLTQLKGSCIRCKQYCYSPCYDVSYFSLN